MNIRHHSFKGKIVFGLLWVFTSLFQIQGWAVPQQEKRLSVSFKNTPLPTAIQTLKTDHGLDFVYVTGLLDGRGNVSVELDQATVPQVLEQVFKNTGISYNIQFGQIVLKNVGAPKPTRQAQPDQPIKVSGGIYDDRNSPLPGVTVYIKGTTTGTFSDMQGRYSIEVPSATDQLVFSFVGFEEQTVMVGNQSTINITLLSTVTDLEEVIITGYGTQKKSDIIGSIASVKGADLAIKANSSFEAGPQGSLQGFPFRRRVVRLVLLRPSRSVVRTLFP
ncbi:STN domain-containing protein [Persicobacter diffluens]|uniref:Secretin/TonB short N-terminal domain-containing protein n=1 Tax=Persicobacter diffluens TaxID=981 RepID=A0AAN5APM1_9BACT|nr:hypothetical protein PEDI_50180 [Persicobacter diffluens]